MKKLIPLAMVAALILASCGEELPLYSSLAKAQALTANQNVKGSPVRLIRAGDTYYASNGKLFLSDAAGASVAFEEYPNAAEGRAYPAAALVSGANPQCADIALYGGNLVAAFRNPITSHGLGVYTLSGSAWTAIAGLENVNVAFLFSAAGRLFVSALAEDSSPLLYEWNGAALSSVTLPSLAADTPDRLVRGVAARDNSEAYVLYGRRLYSWTPGGGLGAQVGSFADAASVRFSPVLDDYLVARRGLVVSAGSGATWSEKSFETIMKPDGSSTTLLTANLALTDAIAVASGSDALILASVEAAKTGVTGIGYLEAFVASGSQLSQASAQYPGQALSGAATRADANNYSASLGSRSISRLESDAASTPTRLFALTHGDGLWANLSPLSPAESKWDRK